MIVQRNKLTWFERLYLPAIAGGFKVTARHLVRTLFGRKNAAKEVAGGYYPETKWKTGPGYRGAPYLVKDQEGNTKCVSCQLCEFVCPPKAIRITPPGPVGSFADRTNAEKMPKEFEINMIRCIFCGFCQEVCPEEAIFLKSDYSINASSRADLIYNKEKLLALGGTHNDQIKKWHHKAEETREQENFPVKP